MSGMAPGSVPSFPLYLFTVGTGTKICAFIPSFLFYLFTIGHVRDGTRICAFIPIVPVYCRHRHQDLCLHSCAHLFTLGHVNTGTKICAFNLILTCLLSVVPALAPRCKKCASMTNTKK
eukprot:TRINITY_DN72381_c0_g1_i1.p1 TRINITY_DN72381_c0_g1~~TRINITY_DN72381_c0_g1_i1.p1  ORF type:complete len:119 (+),score=8.24 TRINITY_DN72381_c0_g1_i1:57-413(+)